MAQKNKVYVGDVGTELIFDIGVNSSEVAKANIIYKKPNGTKGIWAGAIVPNTTEVKYIIGINDLDVPGVYRLQPEITLLSGWKGRGEVVDLFVSEII